MAKFARYYLRSLELAAENNTSPQLLPNDDVRVVDLEHVMPKKPTDKLFNNWPNVTEQDIETHSSRFGNLALLKRETNNAIDQSSFEEKKLCYVNPGCPFIFTNMIAENYGSWGTDEIEQRQKEMAEYATKAWPI